MAPKLAARAAHGLSRPRTSAGAFAVALGCLSERIARDGRPALDTRPVPRGSVLSFGPGYVHEVRNDATVPSVSIHAYSPPLTSMRRFDVAASGPLRATVCTPGTGRSGPWR